MYNKHTISSEMNNADGNFSKITDWINKNMEVEKNKFKTNEILTTEKEAIKFPDKYNNTIENKGEKNTITFEKIRKNLDKIFTDPEEKKELDRRFLLYSSDGIMSNRQFWNFLDLGQISNTTFAKLFYKAACDFNDNTKWDHLKFMDKDKFYQFVAVFTKTTELNECANLFWEGTQLEDIIHLQSGKDGKNKEIAEINTFATLVKLKFWNSLFDVDNNDEVDRLEFRNLISSFIEMILSCKFECAPIQNQIDNILNIDNTGGNNNISQLMEKVLDSYVEEVFTDTYTWETLSFEEWKQWLFREVAGIDEVLKFAKNIVSNAISR